MIKTVKNYLEFYYLVQQAKKKKISELLEYFYAELLCLCNFSLQINKFTVKCPSLQKNPPPVRMYNKYILLIPVTQFKIIFFLYVPFEHSAPLIIVSILV